VKTAIEILNLIISVPEIYVRSVKIPTADCQEVGISHKTSNSVISASKVPEMALSTFILIGCLNFKNFT
jgi:hypothetical protein